jgi:hypothetical protein
MTDKARYNDSATLLPHSHPLYFRGLMESTTRALVVCQCANGCMWPHAVEAKRVTEETEEGNVGSNEEEGKEEESEEEGKEEETDEEGKVGESVEEVP